MSQEQQKGYIEKVIRSFCASSLSAEYDSMTSQDKATLRQTLYSTLQNQMVNIYTQISVNKAKYGNQSSPSTTSSRTSDLAQILQGLFPLSSMDTHEAAPIIEGFISGWGCLHRSSLGQYQRTIAAQRANYIEREQKDMYEMMNTCSVVSKRSSHVSSWNDSLTKISFSDLTLFSASKGCYIEGTIVGEPIQPMVGGTTLLRESTSGRVLLICFYNLLPEGINGRSAEDLLKQEFPMGATLRVVEPFYKIFVDGQRGIRVDNPNELHVIRSTNSNDNDSSSISASRAKEVGNKFVGNKQHIAAIDSYLKGLHTSSESDFVATVLSNRSQAYIQLGEWSQGLLDAAASLTIRPNSDKTWKRYQKCLKYHCNDEDHHKAPQDMKEMKHSNTINKRQALSEIMQKNYFSLDSITSKCVDKANAERLKEEANAAFKKKSFQAAIGSYTRSLEVSGETTRAMLSNWALCTLEIYNFGDALASTIASLRVGYNEKAVYRLVKVLSLLGEYDIALQAFDEFISRQQLSKSSDLTDIRKQIQQCVKYRDTMVNYNGEVENPADVIAMIYSTPDCIGNWRKECVETFMSKGKGRGLRTTRNLPEGSVILVEWPLTKASWDRNESKKMVFSNTQQSKVHSFSSSALQTMVVNRLRRESLLAQILSRMSDGESTPNLCSVSDLLVNVELFPYLLPTHHEYYKMDDTDRSRLIAADRVQKILDINCHGAKEEGKQDLALAVTDKSGLYPAASMMNHASDPNCSFMSTTLDDLSIIVTCKPLSAGDELTMRYQADEVVESKWGIKKE